jgi:hypothetical protein
LKTLSDFRSAMISNVTNVLQGKAHSGAFLPACIIHGLTQGEPFNNPSWVIPDKSNITLESVIYKFINDIDDDLYHVDNVEWPHNTGCNKE